jgi:hypothetical protein
VRKGLRLQREEFSSDLVGPSYGLNVHDWTWRHDLERNGGSIHFAFGSRPSALVEIAVIEKSFLQTSGDDVVRSPIVRLLNHGVVELVASG